MSALARLSLVHRSLIALIAIAVTGFGVYAIPSLKQQLLPSLELPIASVVAAYPGASPEVVQEQVTLPLEDGLRGVPGMSTITSTSSESTGSLKVEFEYGTDLDSAVTTIQQAVERVSSQLPEDVEPQVITGGSDDLPVISLAATAPGDQQALADRLEKRVTPIIEDVADVRDASISGNSERMVTVRPDTAALAANGMTVTDLTDALDKAGTPMPGGSLTEGDQTLLVQAGGAPKTLDALRDLTVSSKAGGKAVRLERVADVDSAPAPATSLTRTNGKPSLGISVTMVPDGDAVSISREVQDKLPELTTALGDGAKLTVVSDQAPAIEKSVETVTTEGALGLLMAVIVILLFLGSLRSTLVTAVSIPLSILFALLSLWVGDLSLNMLTLGALTISVGRVVDDAIVVLENIKRHLSYGTEKREAVLTGVREVAGAVTSSTLITMAVFAPIASVGGMVGELFGPFAITMSVALAASLLVALTVVPVLAYWFLEPAEVDDVEAVRADAEAAEQDGRLERWYVPLLELVTTRRVPTLVIAMVVLIGTLAMVPLLQTTFLSNGGQNTVQLTQEMPAGSSMQHTGEAAGKVEEALSEIPEVESSQVTIGGGGDSADMGAVSSLMGGGGGNSSKASYSVMFDPDADVEEVTAKIRDRIDRIENAGEISIQQDSNGLGGKVEVIVQASDQNALRTASERVERAMRDQSSLTDVGSTLSASTPRVDVRVRSDDAAQHGLTEATIAPMVASAMQGTPVTELTIDGVPQNVVLRTGDTPTSVDDLRSMPIPSATGTVSLDEVADVQQTEGPPELTRIDRKSSVTVSGTAASQDLGAVTADLRERLDGLNLPAGATFEMGGSSADQDEAFAQLGLALVAAIAIVFLLMVATFRSVIQPLVLLVSVPFAATGAILALLLTNTPLGVPSLIGLLMLVGIVVTNAVVLMDLINQYRAEGMNVRDAVIHGSRRRLRPIVMTALATVLALIPMSTGLSGNSGIVGQPLAIVVIGGLISSTVLTLLLVPTLYTMVESARERRRATDDDTPPEDLAKGEDGDDRSEDGTTTGPLPRVIPPGPPARRGTPQGRESPVPSRVPGRAGAPQGPPPGPPAPPRPPGRPGAEPRTAGPPRRPNPRRGVPPRDEDMEDTVVLYPRDFGVGGPRHRR